MRHYQGESSSDFYSPNIVGNVMTKEEVIAMVAKREARLRRRRELGVVNYAAKGQYRRMSL